MPVFHTKTIESILEPVAQQVSKLVILHEEAEDGNEMPDLTSPVQVVKTAVDNLIKVGHDTINHSNDAILKNDMPPSLKRVEDSSNMLLESADNLKQDPFSSIGRKLLIEGSRGILQGTSSLLLAFDESEVRKIIEVCEKVLEFLSLSQIIQTLEDLVVFVQNISPILTRMTKEVDLRSKELTHQLHRESLLKSLEQIKIITPSLISSIKIYITNKNQEGQPLDDALTSRNDINNKLFDEIFEIIRIIQLTKYEENFYQNQLIGILKKIYSSMDIKLKHAKKWLSDPQSTKESAGESAIRSILRDALLVAPKVANGDAILKNISNSEAMLDALGELRQQGEGNSSQAFSLSRGLQESLKTLQLQCKDAAEVISRDVELSRDLPLPVKMEHAQRWMNHPGEDDKLKGYQATKMIVKNSLKMADDLLKDPRDQQEVKGLAGEIHSLADHLKKFTERGEGESIEAKNISKILNQKINQLKNINQKSIIQKVADDFLDINSPLKSLSDASYLPLGTANREEIYEEKLENLDEKWKNMIKTARLLGKSSLHSNKKTLEGLAEEADRLEQIYKQIKKASRLLLSNPDNQSYKEYFEIIKSQGQGCMERLKCYVDEAVDVSLFIQENEQEMKKETERAEKSLSDNNVSSFIAHTSNIARRANRILQTAQAEVDNSEDPNFIQNISKNILNLRNCIPPMIQEAKKSATEEEGGGVSKWREANQRILEAVEDVRLALQEREESRNLPDINQLNIDGNQVHPPLRPPPLSDFIPPRPPPPETDDEFENNFPSPQINQPIMMAAQALHNDAKQWSSRDNYLIAAAKKMALLMAKLSLLVRGEGGTKKDLIDCAKQIAEASEHVTQLAKGLANQCTDKRMRMSLLQVCERIPTIGTQLKILSTVKATMLGANESSSAEDEEATEMLAGNAKNLMESVRETLVVAEGTSIKMRVDSGFTIRWIRRRPWYV